MMFNETAQSSLCRVVRERLLPLSVLVTAKWVVSCTPITLCESRGGRPGLSVLTSLMVSVEVKQY